MWNVPPLDDPVWDNVDDGSLPGGCGWCTPDPGLHRLARRSRSYVENPELAVEFLKFIGSQENAIAMSNTSAGFTPVRQDAWEDIKAAQPVWAKLLDLAVEYGRAFSDIRASAELRPLIVEQAMLYLTDQQSLEDTQQNLKDEYDAILEENGYID